MRDAAPVLRVLKKRSAFLAVAAHRKRWVTTAFVVQAAPQVSGGDGEPEGEAVPVIGLGLTTSKKMVGKKAVDRNRARRRLRALAREYLPLWAQTGHDYVLIARKDALTLDYERLKRDLRWALGKMGLGRD